MHVGLAERRPQDVQARINAPIEDIQRAKGGGIDKPLKGNFVGRASRRINEEHRLVYRTDDTLDELEILSCRYHYSDRQVSKPRRRPRPIRA